MVKRRLAAVAAAIGLLVTTANPASAASLVSFNYFYTGIIECGLGEAVHDFTGPVADNKAFTFSYIGINCPSSSDAPNNEPPGDLYAQAVGFRNGSICATAAASNATVTAVFGIGVVGCTYQAGNRYRTTGTHCLKAFDRNTYCGSETTNDLVVV